MCTTPNKQYADMLDVPAKPARPYTVVGIRLCLRQKNNGLHWTTGKESLTESILIWTKELKPVPETKQEMEFKMEQMTDLQ